MVVLLFNDTATTEIYTLSLHDALPISVGTTQGEPPVATHRPPCDRQGAGRRRRPWHALGCSRSEEHTSELQSRQYLVCRLLLDKKHPKNIHKHQLLDTSSHHVYLMSPQ